MSKIIAFFRRRLILDRVERENDALDSTLVDEVQMLTRALKKRGD